MNLLVSKLCSAACFAPYSVTLQFEEVLCSLAKLDGDCALKCLQVAIPFASFISDRSQSSSTYPVFNGSQAETHDGTDPSVPVRLLAMTVIAEAIKHISSTPLLKELPELLTVVKPSLASVMADIRRAVIVILVEIYLVIGDALYPLVLDLAPAHRKLLTIYVDKVLKERCISVGNMS